MHFYPTERVALFIDGANLYATAKSLGFDIDYKRLLALFGTKGQLIRALYYTALAEEQEYSSIRPLIDWLDYNGYTMVTKPTKEFTDATGRRKIKGNMDIELAVDAMELSEHLDHIVLFSGTTISSSLVGVIRRRRKASGARGLDRSSADSAGDGGRSSWPAGGRSPIFPAQYQPKTKSQRSPPRALRPSTAPGLSGGRSGAQELESSSDVGEPRQPMPLAHETDAAAPEPQPDCPLCPRLVSFRAANRTAHPDWFNGAVPSFGPRESAAPHRRARAGIEGCQSHRAPLPRRLCR